MRRQIEVERNNGWVSAYSFETRKAHSWESGPRFNAGDTVVVIRFSWGNTRTSQGTQLRPMNVDELERFCKEGLKLVDLLRREADESNR